MALTNSFTAAELNDKTGFTITDTGAWGVSGNPAKSQILSDDITVILPASDFSVGTTTATVDLLAKLFPLVPTVTVTYIADMAQTGTMPDGAYQIVRTTVVDEPGGEITYEYTWTMFARRIAECCYQSFVATNSPPCDCAAGKTKVLTIAKWRTALKAVEYAEECQDIPSGVTNLSYATDLCNEEGCETCGC